MSLKSKIIKLENALNPPNQEIVIVAHSENESFRKRQEHLKINPHAHFIIIRPTIINKPPGSGE